MFPIFAGNSAATGYNLTRSLRFRSSASANLSKTFAAAPTVKTKQTISVWVKRANLSTEQDIMAGYDGVSAGGTRLVFQSGNVIEFKFGTSSSLVTNAVYRDPSAWYHIVAVIDTTQSTASNRLSLYVNNVQVTSFSSATYPNQNDSSQFALNNGNNKIGSQDNNANYFDGYMAEFNFIDGQALTPSSFGSTNVLTGVWQPAKYSGSYGTNGFYLPFTDNSALTSASNVGLGKDFSGNGNYWATNNISITSGVTYDSMTDVPTLTSATAANFAVLNPLDIGSGATLSNGNLLLSNASTNIGARSSFGVSTGKWYWESTITVNGSGSIAIGIANSTWTLNYVGSSAFSWGYYSSGSIYNNGSASGSPASYTAGDIIGIALNMDAGTLTFYKNNVSQGTAATGLSGTYFPAISGASSGAIAANFGQQPFTYTAPTGFVALNTYNLPTSTIVKGNTVMDATLYTGTLVSNAITNAASFKPDLVWVKSRSAATDHKLTDSVRGVTKALISDTTGAETTDTQGLTAFGSAGFTVGTDTNYNNLAATYVGWQWQAGQGSTSSNTNGSITSTVSVNASAGFSVVTYTGTGTAKTVGHGLGVAPQLIIGRSRTDSGFNWAVWHISLQTLYGNNDWIRLNTTGAYDTTYDVFDPQNNTSSVFGIGAEATMNANASNFVAYCWTPIAGFSAFGSYTGTSNADGPFIYCGFRPKFIMIKGSSFSIDWYIEDSATNTYNVAGAGLRPNLSASEVATSTTENAIDFLSNGFKIRNNAAGVGYTNSSGQSYIYAAFAENPFKNALAR